MSSGRAAPLGGHQWSSAPRGPPWWQTMAEPPSTRWMRHQHRLAAKKATLPPAATKSSTASRVASLQYSSCPADSSRR
jgi:hypothetical protein